MTNMNINSNLRINNRDINLMNIVIGLRNIYMTKFCNQFIIFHFFYSKPIIKFDYLDSYL